ncbi:hypothetical protein ASPZODRAFT_137898 [Penicilliopsis zonata CBS 506.65]|uniref:Mediator of RNA polymerase II transcription subunit 17 n=1 Tax=Penicilliopsis zonata CBS 506.65 TaxID=1073090 RepID=A0A1L9SUD9_9EURO|nr:hypothetical protein ASPZODRAFT_137898 [Penicilliopsis zonata CBS 506.65]OJJ50756.1 hypothetical protein ASPZODRAFT_137898 [Penicilliopsis zonata CBS 506.65]
MSESFTLPLRPAVRKTEYKDTLPIQIAQINAQWGAFRDVSEESLRAEIQAEKEKGEETADNEEAKGVSDLDSTERLEQLYKRRAEILQFAMVVGGLTAGRQAHFETMFALDFVSLLLSKHTPRQAETSMSAYLKQVTPLGTLNAEPVNPPPKPEAVVSDIKTVSRGWKMQSFKAAANRLLLAATRLEGEVAAETRYWNEVLAVKDKGWKVCRLPRERQALGVQYGFLEATPIFRDRGLYSLGRADDGRLILDKGVVSTRARTVRVRIRENDRLIGRSKLVSTSSSNPESNDNLILQARDTLYEEELFHELVREARVVANQGVTTRQNLIQFAVGEQEILLDLVDVDQAIESENTEQCSGQQGQLAQAIWHSIHILLAYSHRQNLRRRSQAPPPLSQKKRHLPEYPLLRPIMAYLQHNAHVRYLESFLRDVFGVLKSAGLKCNFVSCPFSSVRLPRPNSAGSKVENLVQGFLSPLESTFTASLLNPRSSFNVTIRTSVISPSFGTSYDISIQLPKFPDVQAPTNMGLKEEVTAALTHFIMLDTVAAISMYRPKLPEPPSQVPQEPLTWEATYPHHGELTGSSPAKKPSQRMRITLSRAELTAETHPVRGFEMPTPRNRPTSSKPITSRTWKLFNTAAAPDGTLMEFVAEASRAHS